MVATSIGTGVFDLLVAFLYVLLLAQLLMPAARFDIRCEDAGEIATTVAAAVMFSILIWVLYHTLVAEDASWFHKTKLS